MSALTFSPATKTQAKLRMALIGPAGSGKTMTALKIAKALAEHAGKPIAFIDTEHGSASKYADLVPFDVLELASFHPERYIEAIAAAQGAGYGVLIIDSLSHAWMGKDGALQLVDQATKRQKTANSYTAWGDVTPLHNALIEAMLSARMHIIVTMRSKMEYVQEKDANGKTRVRKIGLQPVQRDGMEFEFDVVADIDTDNLLVVGKTRCPDLAEYQMRKAGPEIAEKLIAWLTDGAVPAPPRPILVQPAPEQPRKLTPDEIARTDKLVDTVKARKMPIGEAMKILHSFGFDKTSHVTAEKFNEVLSALCNWKAPETEPPTTVLTDPEAYVAELATPDPQPAPHVYSEKDRLTEKRQEIRALEQQLRNAGVPQDKIDSVIEAKTGVRDAKHIESFDLDPCIIALETLLEQATAANKKAAKKKA